MNGIFDDTIPGTATADAPLVCKLTDEELAERRIDIASLIAEAQDIVELSDGYAFSFPSDADSVARLVETITAERECCLFFTFVLAFEQNLGPVWLHIKGPAGTKEMIAGITYQSSKPGNGGREAAAAR